MLLCQFPCFAQPDTLHFHSCSERQNSTFSCRAEQYVNTQLPYPPTCHQARLLIPTLGHCKQCHSEHNHTYFFLDLCFMVLVYMPRSGVVGSYGRYIFNFSGHLHVVLHGDWTSSHSKQQYIWNLFSPYSLQHLLFLALFVQTILTCVALISISLVMKDDEHFYHVPISHLYGYVPFQMFRRAQANYLVEEPLAWG